MEIFIETFKGMFIQMFIAYSSGVAISGAIYGFIVAIGLIPRLVYKTKTSKYLLFYETLIITAAIVSGFSTVFQYKIPINIVGLSYIYFVIGIFIGSLAVCVAEVLSVLPIMIRRVKLAKHVTTIMLAVALGKGLGGYVFHTFSIKI